MIGRASKKRLLWIGLLLVATPVLVAWSGLVPIAASGGHWGPVGWFLHWTMHNAVRTQSLGIAVPPHLDLDDPDLVRQAAGHFATGCAPCHGAPGGDAAVVFTNMMPKPPGLVEPVAEWDDAELFWIVKNGIKYTGMPAWPAPQRDDEIWAMVAFLRALPGLSADGYRALAFPDDIATAEHAPGAPADRDDILAACARCHARDGMGQGATGQGAKAFPIIAGQAEAYLRATLDAYRAGRRHSGPMQAAAGSLSEPAVRELARHFHAEARRPADAAAPDPERQAYGERIVRRGIPALGVPACDACHGDDAIRRNPGFPELRGQHTAYLAQHLRLFKAGRRGGTPYAGVMRMIAQDLPEEAIDAVAHFYSQTAQ